MTTPFANEVSDANVLLDAEFAEEFKILAREPESGDVNGRPVPGSGPVVTFRGIFSEPSGNMTPKGRGMAGSWASEIVAAPALIDAPASAFAFEVPAEGWEAVRTDTGERFSITEAKPDGLGRLIFKLVRLPS